MNNPASFRKNGFLVIKNMYDVNNHSPRIVDLFAYTKTLPDGIYNDNQSPGSPSFYKNTEMNKIQIKMLSKMEEFTGMKLYPTYNYFRIYNSNSILDAHTDREACEISCTINVGYDGNYSWPIWIRDNNEKNHSVTLEVGDGVIYMGCKNLHWREPADKRVICQTQLFIHYVEQDGPYEDSVFDVGNK